MANQQIVMETTKITTTTLRQVMDTILCPGCYSINSKYDDSKKGMPVVYSVDNGRTWEPLKVLVTRMIGTSDYDLVMPYNNGWIIKGYCSEQ